MLSLWVRVVVVVVAAAEALVVCAMTTYLVRQVGDLAAVVPRCLSWQRRLRGVHSQRFHSLDTFCLILEKENDVNNLGQLRDFGGKNSLMCPSWWHTLHLLTAERGFTLGAAARPWTESLPVAVETTPDALPVIVDGPVEVAPVSKRAHECE